MSSPQREETISAFLRLFGKLGYVVCESATLEPAFEKVAIYATLGVPTHAARQLPHGRWESKLGPWERIEHDVDALEGTGPNEYGRIVQIMRRRRKALVRVGDWLIGIGEKLKARGN